MGHGFLQFLDMQLWNEAILSQMYMHINHKWDWLITDSLHNFLHEHRIPEIPLHNHELYCEQVASTVQLLQ